GFCGTSSPIGGYYNGTSACDATALTTGVWAHFAATFDGSQVRLYKDGVLLVTSPSTNLIPSSAGTLQIGSSQFSEFYSGLIDEIRVYDQAIPLSSGTNG